MKLWICRKCGHEMLANDHPKPIHWTDGHSCVFSEQEEGETYGAYSPEPYGSDMSWK